MKDEFCKNRPAIAIAQLIRDSRGRTLAKTLVYRFVAIALLAGITYYYTGSAGEATTITILFNVMGTVAYYGLERIWEDVFWGRGRLGSSVREGSREPASLSFEGTSAAPPPGTIRTGSEANSSE